MEHLLAAVAAPAAAPAEGACAEQAVPAHARLSTKERWACVVLHEDRQTVRAIAEKMHCAVNTVCHWIHAYERTGDVQDAPRSGRPRCTDEAADTNIALTAMLEPFTSPRHIIRTLDLDASRQTVDRRLQEAGLYGRVARHKRDYSEAEIRKRMSFAEGYQHWTTADWDRVLFSDEKCFYGSGFCGRIWVRREKGEALNPKYCVSKIAHPVKVNVWACFCSAGQGYTYIFNDTLDTKLLKKIFDEGHLLQSAEDRGLVDAGQWYFLQDNDPKHRSAPIQKWLHDHGISCIDFPPYSPDLNPIENLWNTLQRDVERRACDTLESLQDAVEAAWNKLDPEHMRALVHSMPARCQAVIDAQGWHTKY
jgi:transposase